MSVEENKAVVDRLIEEFFNEKKLDVADEICAPQCAIHDPRCPEGMFGPGLVKALGALYQVGFPDLRYKVEDTICAGDRVVTRWKARCTHEGELQMSETLVLPPTGRALKFGGITICRVADGKITDIWQQIDMLDVYLQVGAASMVEDPGAVEAATEDDG